VTQDHTHLYDGVHRTRLLTEAAVDAFGHVDVVASRPPAAIGAGFSFDGDGLDTHSDGDDSAEPQAFLCSLAGVHYNAHVHLQLTSNLYLTI